MAVEYYPEVTKRDAFRENGHIRVYDVKCHSLDVLGRTFRPHLFNPHCPKTEISWMVEMKSQRTSKGNSNYTFSVKVKRYNGPVEKGVRISIRACFYDVNGIPIYIELNSSKDNVYENDEFEARLEEIDASVVKDITQIQVILKTEFCHSKSDRKRPLNLVDIVENCMHLSKL